MVSVPGLQVSLCFRMRGTPGDVIRLLQDPVSEVVVNARVVENPDSNRTYLGAVSLRRRRFEVLAKPRYLHINGYRIPWGNRTHGLLVQGHRLIISPAMVAITLRSRKLTVAVMRHEDITTRSQHFRYMGFYVTDSRQLSTRTHGMLGQFIHMRVVVRQLKVRGSRMIGKLSASSPSRNYRRVVRAVLRQHRNLATNASTNCWTLRKRGRGVVAGSYRHYVVSSMRNATLLPL